MASLSKINDGSVKTSASKLSDHLFPGFRAHLHRPAHSDPRCPGHRPRREEQLMSLLTCTTDLATYLVIGALLFGIGHLRHGDPPHAHRHADCRGTAPVRGLRSTSWPSTVSLAPDPTVGQIFTLFIMAIAAAEAAIGLSIIIAVYRNYKSLTRKICRATQRLEIWTICHGYAIRSVSEPAAGRPAHPARWHAWW